MCAIRRAQGKPEFAGFCYGWGFGAGRQAGNPTPDRPDMGGIPDLAAQKIYKQIGLK